MERALVVRDRIKLFEDKFQKGPDCWIWQGAKTARYGSFYCPEFPGAGKMVSAHKASLFLYENLPTSSEEEVMHSCDNGFCVNPSHLSVGTHRDNMLDMAKKGRYRIPSQKLDRVDVIMARQMRRSGLMVKEVAEHFNISDSQMSRLVSGVLPKGSGSHGHPI